MARCIIRVSYRNNGWVIWTVVCLLHSGQAARFFKAACKHPLQNTCPQSVHHIVVMSSKHIEHVTRTFSMLPLRSRFASVGGLPALALVPGAAPALLLPPPP